MNQAWMASGQLLPGIFPINEQICWPAALERSVTLQNIFF
jgi:hypothetical protein